MQSNQPKRLHPADHTSTSITAIAGSGATPAQTMAVTVDVTVATVDVTAQTMAVTAQTMAVTVATIHRQLAE